MPFHPRPGDFNCFTPTKKKKKKQKMKQEDESEKRERKKKEKNSDSKMGYITSRNLSVFRSSRVYSDERFQQCVARYFHRGNPSKVDFFKFCASRFTIVIIEVS